MHHTDIVFCCFVYMMLYCGRNVIILCAVSCVCPTRVLGTLRNHTGGSNTKKDSNRLVVVQWLCYERLSSPFLLARP